MQKEDFFFLKKEESFGIQNISSKCIDNLEGIKAFK